MFGDGVDYYLYSFRDIFVLLEFFWGFLDWNRYWVLIADADSAFSVGKIMASGVYAVIIPPNCLIQSCVLEPEIVGVV